MAGTAHASLFDRCEDHITEENWRAVPPVPDQNEIDLLVTANPDTPEAVCDMRSYITDFKAK